MSTAPNRSTPLTECRARRAGQGPRACKAGWAGAGWMASLLHAWPSVVLQMHHGVLICSEVRWMLNRLRMCFGKCGRCLQKPR
eukprot:10052422-Alexandrium_andersonii.AAC.1